MIDLAAATILDFTGALAQRGPAPGGGAAAGVVAAFGCALSAMSARYTSGKRFSAEAIQAAEQLAEQVDTAAQECLHLGEADANAYANVQVLRQAKASADEIAAAEQAARNVPLSLLRTLVAQAELTLQFKSQCNHWLLSDLRAALHLMAGAGDAAWEMLVAGDPPSDERSEGHELCKALRCMSLSQRSPETLAS